MEMQSIVKEAIDKWADGQKVRAFSDMKYDVEITESKALAVPMTFMTALREYRKIEKDRRGYPIGKMASLNEQNIVFDEDALDPWKRESSLKVNGFEDKSANFYLEGSGHAEVCEKCHGKKEVACNTCHESGIETCHTCGGHGDLNCNVCGGSSSVSCTSCGGKGSTSQQRVKEWRDSSGNFHRDIDYDNVTCSYCGGSGEEDCRNCSSGSVTCYNCRGSGEVTCGTCGGKGSLTCSTCDGQGAVEAFLRFDHKIYKVIWIKYYTDDEISKRYSFFENNDVSEFQGLKEKSMLVEEGPYSHESATKGLLMDKKYLSKVKSNFDKFFEPHPDHLLINKMIIESEKDYLLVTYIYKGESYYGVVDPKTSIFYPSESPVDSYLENLCENVKLETKDVFKAYATAQDYRRLKIKSDDYKELEKIYFQLYDKIKFKLFMSGQLTVILFVCLVGISEKMSRGYIKFPLFYITLWFLSFVVSAFWQKIYTIMVINSKPEQKMQAYIPNVFIVLVICIVIKTMLTG